MSAPPVLQVHEGLVPLDAARLDPRDRGFTLGDGLFETIRAERGRVPWLDRHLARLRAAADTIGLSLPWSDLQLAHGIAQTLAANELADAVVRLTVTRWVPSHRGLLAEAPGRPSLVIHAEPFARYAPALYARGMRAITSRIPHNEHSPLARLKSLSYLEHVLARGEAHAADADEAFLTSALLGVMPLTSVDGRPIGDGVPGPVTGAPSSAPRGPP